MYTCKTCGKEYENRHSYIGHCSSHNRGESFKLGRKKENSHKIKKEKPVSSKVCKYCNLSFENGQKLAGHQTWCKLNPNLIYTKSKISLISTGRILSDSQKRKISESRKKYLDENPGRIPYLLNHSSNESYPEKLFRLALEKNNITGWEYNYPVKRYSLDFAFIDNMIDVEIDGETHNLEEVAAKDKIRTEELSKLGWKTLRFTSKEIKNNIEECIKILLIHLK
jgi:very-short-patch-repair endonuclease/uncharacterized C2H2 Zn-finger protein